MICTSYRYGILPVAVLLGSCNSTANKKLSTAKDSIPYITLATPVPLSSAEAQQLYNGCEQWYDSALKLRGFNGGMLVAKNGNIVFEAYNGNGHLNRHDVIDSLTPFHIASVSKTFTAMAVLKLWQNGKLNIDEEFSKYFPSFNYPGITIRNLLSHRSGLPNYLYFMETLGWDKSKLIQNEDVLNYLITRKAEIPNISAPNTHFTYCNTNYALLALLVEKVSGKKFPDFLQQTFFTPLQMKHTFLFNSLDTSKVNPSYDWRGRIIPLNFLDGVYGDKNIYTTPRDLLLWDRGLTSGKIFKPQTLKEAYTPYSNEKAGIKNYGLGWRMNIYPNGKKTIYHNGWWHGNNAAFLRLLKDSVTIIVVGNKYNSNIYHAKELANLFGGYDGAGAEDEETENAKVNDNLLLLKPDSLVFKNPVLSDKEALLQQKLMDRSKRKKP
jgi:CubicO group peptidase (beta-lactamase class C family)